MYYGTCNTEKNVAIEKTYHIRAFLFSFKCLISDFTAVSGYESELFSDSDLAKTFGFFRILIPNTGLVQDGVVCLTKLEVENLETENL
jgi:hypothetical protein